jgi:DNA-binding transcriptional LysR family regulator
MGLMASKGMGIGILPDSTVFALADSASLRLIDLDEPWAQRKFILCVRSSQALDRPATRLLNFLADQVASPLATAQERV